MTYYGKSKLGQKKYLYKLSVFSMEKNCMICIYIDFGALNNVIIKDNNPLPHINDIFNQLVGQNTLVI